MQKPLIEILKEALQKSEREQQTFTLSVRRISTVQSVIASLIFILAGAGLSVNFYFGALGYHELDPFTVVVGVACIPIGIMGLVFPETIEQWQNVRTMNKKFATLQMVVFGVGIASWYCVPSRTKALDIAVLGQAIQRFPTPTVAEMIAPP